MNHSIAETHDLNDESILVSQAANGPKYLFDSPEVMSQARGASTSSRVKRSKVTVG
jgi:hypothetical protein